MARSYSVKRSTRRWPISLFFTFLDITGVNVQTICKLNNVQPALNIKRDLLLYQLGCELAAEYVSKREHDRISIDHKISMNEILATSNKTNDKKFDLINILNSENENQENSINASNEAASGVCFLCSKELLEKKKESFSFKIPSYRERSKFKRQCIECKNFICKKHSSCTMLY